MEKTSGSVTRKNIKPSMRTAAEAVTDFADAASKIAGKDMYQQLYKIGEKYYLELVLEDDQSRTYDDIIADIEAMEGFTKQDKSVEIADKLISIANKEE